MITAFSQNDVNDINIENFSRNELYDIWIALNEYANKKLNQDELDRENEIQNTMTKIKNLIKVDLENEK